MASVTSETRQNMWHENWGYQFLLLSVTLGRVCISDVTLEDPLSVCWVHAQVSDPTDLFSWRSGYMLPVTSAPAGYTEVNVFHLRSDETLPVELDPDAHYTYGDHERIEQIHSDVAQNLCQPCHILGMALWVRDNILDDENVKKRELEERFNFCKLNSHWCNMFWAMYKT